MTVNGKPLGCAFLLVGIPAMLLCEPVTWRGEDPEKPGDWHCARNWSSGKVPGPDSAEGVVIPSGAKTYPTLGADASVGGSLRLAEGARLTLNGRHLSVGAAHPDTVDGPNTTYSHGNPKGLVIGKGASLDATEGASEIHVRTGGLVNEGKLFGAPTLCLAGVYHGFVVKPGELKLAGLRLAPAVFPYRVNVAGSLAVTGNVELYGGDLTIDAGKTLEIGGDLVFPGQTPCASVTPQGDVLVQGTVRSEGASRYVTGASGWVKMVGPGDQAISAGGVLPPLCIAKKSGKVTVTGDLHCAGLLVEPGNVLELAKGQSLVLGVPFREWKTDPKSIIVIYAARPVIPTWGWRGLLNRGTVLGRPNVPFTLLFPDQETVYEVRGTYFFKRKPTRGQALVPANPHVGDLSIGGPDSRLTVKDDELLLDGLSAAEVGAPSKRGKDEELDSDEDEVDGSDLEKPLGGGTGGKDEEERARVRNLSIRKVEPASIDRNVLANVAPHAARIRSSPSIGVDVYNTADGSDLTLASFRGGVTQFGTYQFDFAVPVNVSAVRFLQGGLWATQYVVYGDATNDGTCETVLAYGSGGAPNAWRELRFPPTKVHSLKFRSLGGQCGWEKSSPDIREFEIYADKPSFELASKATPLKVPEPYAKDAGHFSVGDEVRVAWPEPRPEDRVLRLITTDLWMLGIQTEASSPKGHLRDCQQLLSVIRDIKSMGADGTLLFIEAEMKAFWPSKHFESLTNEKFFADRRARMLPQPKESTADILEKKDKDAAKEEEGLDETPPLEESEKEGSGKKGGPDAESGAAALKPLAVEDLPNQRDLLKELCETMHENGLKVYFIVLGRYFECYVGPTDQDPWKLLIEEVVSRGVDGMSLTADEAGMGMYHPPKKDNPDYEPTLQAFRERFGPDAELPPDIWQQTVANKRWVLFGYERSARRLKDCHELVKRINPECATFTNISSGAVSANNRMTYGLGYDVIGHIAGLDYFGTDYQEQEQCVWTAATRHRRGCMELFVPRSVREGIQCVLQGARFVSYYRYNYIEMQKSADHRTREFALMKAMERWGATRPARAKTAVLISRASENWWDNNHGTNWLGWNPVAKQGFWTHRAILAFLLHNGYPFDLYYLDQIESVEDLSQHRLIILPFPYSVKAADVAILNKARENGSRLLIAQKQGEVDEVGREHPAPVLHALVESGQKDGSVLFLDRDMVDYETERPFTDDLKRMLDALLGDHKELYLYKHGHQVVGHLSVCGPGQRYLTLVNWQESEAEVEVGLSLPKGSYKLLSVSSGSPREERQGLIDGKGDVSEAVLSRFIVRLRPAEVKLVYLVPSERPWGQR
jgi:hypothetical protein